MKEVVLILYPILIFIFTFLFQIFFIIIKERRLRNKLCQKDNQKLYKSKKIIIKILIAFVISFVLAAAFIAFFVFGFAVLYGLREGH